MTFNKLFGLPGGAAGGGYGLAGIRGGPFSGQLLERVDFSEAAADMLRQRTKQHGPLMFHQSGGCSPMCYPDGEFRTSNSDVHLGDLVIDASRSRSASGGRLRSSNTGATPT